MTQIELRLTIDVGDDDFDVSRMDVTQLYLEFQDSRIGACDGVALNPCAFDDQDPEDPVSAVILEAEARVLGPSGYDEQPRRCGLDY